MDRSVDAWAPAGFSCSLGQSGGGTICVSHGSPSVSVWFDGLQKTFAIAQLSPRSRLKHCPPGLSQSSAPAPGRLSPPPALTADPTAPTVRGPRGASPAERSWVDAPAADSGLFPAGLPRGRVQPLGARPGCVAGERLPFLGTAHLLSERRLHFPPLAAWAPAKCAPAPPRGATRADVPLMVGVGGMSLWPLLLNSRPPTQTHGLPYL